MKLYFRKEIWKPGPRLVLTVIILLLSSVGVCYSVVNNFVGILMFAVLLFFNLIRLEFDSQHEWIFGAFGGLFAAFLANYSGLLVNYIGYDNFYNQGFFSALSFLVVPYYNIQIFIAEMALVLIVYFVLKMFMIPTKVALVLSVVPFLIFYIANYEVYILRGFDFLFPDIYAANTAANVIGNQVFKFENPIIFAAIPYVLFCLAVFSTKTDRRKTKWYTSMSMNLALSVLVAIISITYISGLAEGRSIQTWQHHGTMINSPLMNFILSADSVFVDTPEGYSEERINDYLESNNIIQTSTVEANGEEPVNIIVIMSESFVDPSTWPDDYQPSNDPIPFWHSLEENTIHGMASVAIFGGGTANSEFEMLTSLSTAFLGQGVTPYTLCIDENTYSLAYYLGSLGYRTLAMHPFESSGWNRTNVYQYFGFDEMYFEDDMSPDEDDIVRNYISDQYAYDYMLDQMDSEEGPTFAFLVTMQNHSTYIPMDDNFDNYQYFNYGGLLTDLQTDLTNEYCSLLSRSDEALEYLLSNLSSRDEKYAVLIFGDHQPNLTWNYAGSATYAYSSWVPYVIWTNYDMPQEMQEYSYENYGFSSLNYLALDLLKAAGIEYNSYYKYFDSMRTYIPCINQNFYVSAGDGNMYPVNYGIDEDVIGVLNVFHYLQYDILQDSSNSNQLTSDLNDYMQE
ncbi:MAG TPA: LTA synthase family protein [Saccharofermentans sp.]|nr:LTA synthase family protein [Saccharofermentans sp.]HUM24119.1 LTA synthase family protein [Saccharofermentans sp.]